jgi:hypothetical protein
MRPDAANGAQEIQRCSRCGPESAGSLAVSNGPVASASRSDAGQQIRRARTRDCRRRKRPIHRGRRCSGRARPPSRDPGRRGPAGLLATCGACSRALRRLPWVLVALALSALAAAVIGRIRAGAAGQRLFAIFIPLLRITLADAGDTLTEAIAVRGLSLRHCPLCAPIQNEVATRGPIGLSLAVPALFGSGPWFRTRASHSA